MNYYFYTELLLIGFIILGTFDGLYFHIIKYKLHLQPSARLEHRIHCARGMIFAPVALLTFAYRPSGLMLLFNCFLIGIDLILEIIDIFVEKKSREPLGGIAPAESVMHVFASSFRAAAIALIIVPQLLSFSFSNLVEQPLFLDSSEIPDSLRIIAFGFAIVCVLGSILTIGKKPLEYLNEFLRNLKGSKASSL
ncbi:MAG: hypothetical protein NT027_04705 [Proteobacteria bacterium]|nr:hypothetical protein [Pseudomonadota bacterium]